MAKAKRDKANYVIQSVAHALDVLEELATAESAEYGVTELARKLELHKNNVFRLLATLEARGYVEQNKLTENYRLGVRSLELGQSFVRQTGLVSQARPILAALVRELGETCHVAVIRNQAVVYIDAIESPKTVRVVSRVGSHLPIHATASGKAHLAFESDDEVERALARPVDARSLVDADVLRKELQKISALGYAVDVGEQDDAEVTSVAAPIRDYTSRVVGAISVSAPAHRVTAERLATEVGPRVARAGADISHRLGHGLDRASNA